MDAHLHGLVRNIGVVMLLSKSNEENLILLKTKFKSPRMNRLQQ